VWPLSSADTVCPRPSLITFDGLTLKLVCESHLRLWTFLSNLGMIGLWVLELFATYATDRQTDGLTDGWTDGRTKARLIASSLRARGHDNVTCNNSVVVVVVLVVVVQFNNAFLSKYTRRVYYSKFVIFDQYLALSCKRFQIAYEP